jgi:lysozyme family protein
MTVFFASHAQMTTSLSQNTKHYTCGKSTRKGKYTTDAGTDSSRIGLLVIISWEDVLYLVHALLDTQDDHTR